MNNSRKTIARVGITLPQPLQWIEMSLTRKIGYISIYCKRQWLRGIFTLPLWIRLANNKQNRLCLTKEQVLRIFEQETSYIQYLPLDRSELEKWLDSTHEKIIIESVALAKLTKSWTSVDITFLEDADYEQGDNIHKLKVECYHG